jgi:hypothetical protein
MSDLEEDDFPISNSNGRLSDTEEVTQSHFSPMFPRVGEGPDPIPEGWADAPTFRDQGNKIPESITQGPPITRVLNRSDQQDLDFLNDLQRRAHDPSGPKSVILSIDRKFHDGSWYIYLTYSRIIYLKL